MKVPLSPSTSSVDTNAIISSFMKVLRELLIIMPTHLNVKCHRRRPQHEHQMHVAGSVAEEKGEKVHQEHPVRDLL
jgi:hypothetical protein